MKEDQFTTTKEEEVVAKTSMSIQQWMRKGLEEHRPDLLHEMVALFSQALMSADAESLCGAAYRERSEGRQNRRNGFRVPRHDSVPQSVPSVSVMLHRGCRPRGDDPLIREQVLAIHGSSFPGTGHGKALCPDR